MLRPNLGTRYVIHPLYCQHHFMRHILLDIIKPLNRMNSFRTLSIKQTVRQELL